MNECREVADTFTTLPQNRDEAYAMVKAAMPDESYTIISNVAEALLDRAWAEFDKQARGVSA